MTRDEYSTRRHSGKAMPALLALVVLLGVGGYNYHRNWSVEQVELTHRPFRSYAMDDLTSLQSAYEAEASEYERRYSSQDRARYRASGEGLMAERVQEFERIKRNSESLRALGGEVATREAQIAEIKREIDYRLAMGAGLQIHLRRLTTI
jgi:hypothetical protein